MRHWVTGLTATAMLLALTGCQRAAVPVAPMAPAQAPVAPVRPAPAAPAGATEPVSFKGMELYSLKGSDGRWYYYVLGGTNRQKRLSEVTASSAAVGTEAVKVYLRSLPPGSSLAWSTQVVVDRPGAAVLALPDGETVRQIQTVCRQSGIDLQLPTANLPPATAATFRR
jgi:hypothetical protein